MGGKNEWKLFVFIILLLWPPWQKAPSYLGSEELVNYPLCAKSFSTLPSDQRKGEFTSQVKPRLVSFSYSFPRLASWSVIFLNHLTCAIYLPCLNEGKRCWRLQRGRRTVHSKGRKEWYCQVSGRKTYSEAVNETTAPTQWDGLLGRDLLTVIQNRLLQQLRTSFPTKWRLETSLRILRKVSLALLELKGGRETRKHNILKKEKHPPERAQESK